MLWSGLSLSQVWPAWHDVSKKVCSAWGHKTQQQPQVKGTSPRAWSCKCSSSCHIVTTVLVVIFAVCLLGWSLWIIALVTYLPIQYLMTLIRKSFFTMMRKLWIYLPHLLHLTATSKISLQLIFLLVFDDLPLFQCLCATCATSKMANPIARWCLTLGRNPAELYWINGPKVEDLHTKNCKQRMRHFCFKVVISTHRPIPKTWIPLQSQGRKL